MSIKKQFYNLYPEASKLNYTFIPNNIIDIFYNVQIFAIKKSIRKIKKQLLKLTKNKNFYVQHSSCCDSCHSKYYGSCNVDSYNKCSKPKFFHAYRIYERIGYMKDIPLAFICNNIKFQKFVFGWLPFTHKYCVYDKKFSDTVLNIHFDIGLNINILTHIIRDLYNERKIKIIKGNGYEWTAQRDWLGINFFLV